LLRGLPAVAHENALLFAMLSCLAPQTRKWYGGGGAKLRHGGAGWLIAATPRTVVCGRAAV